MDIRYENEQFVAYDRNIIIASSKNRDYLKRKVQGMRPGVALAAAPVVRAAAAVDAFAINERFEFTEQLVKMVASGETASCVITGEGGLGKTYSVLKALRSAGLTDISEYVSGDVVHTRKAFRVVKGFSTARGLYRILFENKNAILVFDDCDSILKDPDAINLLKGALDSYDKRWITWNTNVSDDGIPRSFEFKGGVVFISNMPAEKISQAIRSRSMNVDLSMTTDQKLDRMEHIMVCAEFMPGVPLMHKRDAMDLIKQNVDSAREISLRTLINVTKIRHSGSANWAGLAKYMLVN